MRTERFMFMACTQYNSECQPLPEWPQHMTVTPWMTGDVVPLIEEIEDHIGSSIGTIQALITGEEHFGPHNEVKVWTLEETDLIRSLHTRALELTSRLGTPLEDETFVGLRYRPHITQKPGQPERSIGQRLFLTHVSVVGKVAGQKTILRNIGL